MKKTLPCCSSGNSSCEQQTTLFFLFLERPQYVLADMQKSVVAQFWPPLGALKQDKYDYSVHTRQSKNMRLKSWKLFFLTSERKHQAPFSFALVFIFQSRSFTSQSPPVGTPSSCDPFQVAPERGEEAVTNVIAEAADGKARDTRSRRASAELGRRNSSLRRKVCLSFSSPDHMTKLGNRQRDIIA